MKERPILFSASMVRAVLEGRKTQTRRVIKLNSDGRAQLYGKNWHLSDSDAIEACPYGIVGDRLWVREAWAQDLDCEVFYSADHQIKPSTIEKWRPSIFMPKSISRITLELTDVRVEHLQSITYIDAMNEGVNYEKGYQDPRESYQHLWDSINGKKYPWSSNPWIWVIEFHTVTMP